MSEEPVKQYSAFIEKLKKSWDNNIEIENKIRKKNLFLIDEDARLLALGRLRNLIADTTLLLILIKNQLLPLDNPWWTTIEKPDFIDDSEIFRVAIIDGLTHKFIKFGFLQFLLGNLDNHLRIFLRVIDSEACNRATSEFASIYNCLINNIFLKTFPQKDEFINLLDLLRNSRNTIHNNGVYFHKKRADAEVIYKGVSYKFKIGEPIDFVTWDWSIEMLDDVQRFYEAVLSTEKLQTRDMIYDPFIHDINFTI